ncbi:penicillin-binding protein [Arthrobacter sp. Sa2CUA1]|uniref:Penicillin-binding protein n=1 Tax=Arthrobacter gallicola TaxID=2762225 RepID=A0ABR8UT96_9MICC|nr:penicillin-binding transpeptidase domain-containing protein [Arthrobacter gallicola]MBD7995743.1 penicillin-binding protein [Arthrobacter gallicola]
MVKHRLIAAAVSVSVLALSLSACSPEEGPGPEAAAETLAAGLSALDVTGSAFVDSSVEAVNGMLEHLVSGMAPLKPSVTVTKIEDVSDSQAAATLHYVWDVNAAAEDYSYDATVLLDRGEDNTWQARFTSTTVHPELDPTERLLRTTAPVRRGDILGAGGAVLMADRAVWHVGIDKVWLTEKEYASSAFYLSQYLNIDTDAFTAKVRAAGPKDFVEAVTVRQDSVPANFESEIATVPGAAALPEVRSLAQSGSFAGALLGSVGEATPELIEQSGGSLAAGDQTGLSGLQREYDTQLRGADAVTVQIATADNVRSAPLFETAGEAGKPLQTTLNAGIQTQAESALKDEPSAAALVAIQPSTGNILAAANGPGSGGAQTALLGQFAPGSAFQLATALAMLRTGAAPDTEVSCPADVTVDGRTFANPAGYPSGYLGGITLAEAFAQSCDTAFVNARDSVSQSDLSAAGAGLGLGVDSAIGTPAYFGSVPETADGALHAASMIGQGEVLVSPLALAVAGASVAKGERVSPALVSSADSGTDSTQSPQAPAPVTAEEAGTLRELMRGVVTDGSAQLLEDVPGNPVLAKNGAAGFGGETPPRTHAWVVAVHGDLAVALFIERGETAPAPAETLMKTFLDALTG